MVSGARAESGPSTAASQAETTKKGAELRPAGRDEGRATGPRAQAGTGAPSQDNKAAGSTILLRATWGSGPNELGRSTPSEGAPEGPMSFTVGKDGEVIVLDQVNQRIQIFAPGKDPQSIPLGKDTYQDIEVRSDGSIAVLDRLVSKSVDVLDRSGKVVASAPLVGPGVEEGGAVTAMFSREDGTWVEVNNGELVRVADASGRPDPDRPTAPGRLAAGGAMLRASRTAEGAVITSESPIPGGGFSGPSVLATVAFPMPLMAITALESSPSGVIAIGAFQMREAEAPQTGAAEAAHTVVLLSKDGREIGRAPLALPTSLEQFRPIRLLADGSIYQLGCGGDGATIAKVTL